MKSLRTITLLGTLLCSSAVSAGTITYSSYSSHSNGLISFQELSQDWLNLGVTKGMSFNTAESTFQSEGFRVANFTDITGMLDEIGVAPSGNCQYLSDQTLCRNGNLPDYSDPLFDAFTETGNYSGGANLDIHALWEMDPSYGLDGYDWATLAVRLWADTDGGLDEDLSLTQGIYSRDYSRSNMAVFMVRDIQSVPVPSSFVLLGIGLMATGFSKRRKT